MSALPRVVLVPGVFDTLHRGHINLLWRARQLCDVLIVGVVSDRGARAYKGRAPVEDQETRLLNIAQLSFVDAVEIQPTTDPSPLLERFRPDALIHGDDWRELREGNETLERLGIKFVTLPYTHGISSSQLRAVG